MWWNGLLFEVILFLAGILNGLKLILDVETFDHAFEDRGAAGFRIALTDPRDQGLIYQDGSNVMPGLHHINEELLEESE